MSKVKNNKVRSRLLILLIIGLALIEFPGILFINRVEPFIFGMPFIYGFVLIVWICLCLLLFYAYKKNWGEKVNK